MKIYFTIEVLNASYQSDNYCCLITETGLSKLALSEIGTQCVYVGKYD